VISSFLDYIVRHAQIGEMVHLADGPQNVVRNLNVSVKRGNMKTLRTWLMVGLMIAVAGLEGQALADGADGSTYVLTSFDGDFNLIGGLNDQGRSFQAVYGSTTRFREAALEKFAPTDPCRTWAEGYNTPIQNDTVGFNAILAGMVTDSCKARVLVDKKNPIWLIRSFEPVP